MSRRRYGYRSNSMMKSGQVYETGAATFEVRRHSLKRVIDVPPGKAKIVPLLMFYPTELAGVAVKAVSKITREGSKVYVHFANQDGSYTKWLHLDITITPKELSSSQILDFYVSRGMFSFTDIQSGEVFGLSQKTDGTVQFSNEAKTPVLTDVISSAGVINNPPELALTKETYDLGDVIKHYWGMPQKNVMYGGQPVLYNKWEQVPAKCRRSNRGMFYGMLVMNDAPSIPDKDTDVLRIEIKENYKEKPLIQ